MAKKKTLVYTVNMGGYDRVLPAREVSPLCDYKLYTDSSKYGSKGWTTVVVEKHKNSLLQTRHLKLCIHKIEPGYDTYIYLDANYEIKKDIYEYVKSSFKGGLMLHAHPTRDCIFVEAKRVISLKMVKEAAVVKQMQAYSMAGLPRRYGLFTNGFLARDRSVDKFMELWFQELENYNYRDQLSLPFLMYKHRPQVTVRQYFLLKRYLHLHPHVKDRQEAPGGAAMIPAPKVWYFTPGRGDKNLGAAYNEHCNLVPDGDWICIRDGDTIFLNPFWSKQIEDIIVKWGSKYPLISCVTNRLGLEWQLPFGFDENPNILDHAERANDLFHKHYDDVVRSQRQTAGLFMLFPKSTWKAVPFKEGLTNKGTFVDFSFADGVMKNLGSIGIAKGIYLFHFYRMDKPNKRYIEHLL